MSALARGAIRLSGYENWLLVAGRWLLAAANTEQPATSNQQPATSNQQPATSNQQPAPSNQQPNARSTDRRRRAVRVGGGDLGAARGIAGSGRRRGIGGEHHRAVSNLRPLFLDRRKTLAR